MPVLPEYSLAGKVAILASAGGDEAPLLAQSLAEAGAGVYVVARNQVRLDAILSALAAVGSGGTSADGHDGIATELKSEASVSQVMAAVERKYSRVDILVNDGRSNFAKPLLEISSEEWDEVQSRNLRSAFLLSREVGRRMIAQQYGRVVNLVSGLAERGMINGSAFNASQAGLLSLTRSLAVEWGRHNIRVNAIGSGWTTAEDIPPEVQQQEQLVRYIPLRHKGQPKDIGPLLVYLCSEACDYTTGQPVYVDGGLNAHP